MTKTDILNCVVHCHNNISQIMVNGDGAVLMGEALKELRTLAAALQNDITDEKSPDKANEGGVEHGTDRPV